MVDDDDVNDDDDDAEGDKYHDNDVGDDQWKER